MKVSTTIANNIHIADDKARYDAACRRLLSDKMILAWIMKNCLEEFRDCGIKEIADQYIEGKPSVADVPVHPDEEALSGAPMSSGMENKDVTITEGKITYDIRFQAMVPSSGEQIRLIVNIEAQNDFYPGYPLIKRALYYCSRMISSQYGKEFTESRYDEIKKVYSIWICMNPPKNRENSITRYCITEENLVGSVKEEKRHYDLMTAIMICLGGAESRDYTGILKLLDVLLSADKKPEEKCRILEHDFSIEMTHSLESEVSLMCNLSEGVERRGIEKGLIKGIEQGLEKGMEQGKIYGLIEAYRDDNLPETEIIARLQKKFGLTESEIRKYLD